MNLSLTLTIADSFLTQTPVSSIGMLGVIVYPCSIGASPYDLLTHTVLTFPSERPQTDHVFYGAVWKTSNNRD